MKIIGHRGAAGLKLENSLESFRTAAHYGVDAIEFDVHATKDHGLVICHDANTEKVSDIKLSISHSTLKQLQKVTLKNGETLPTIESAFQALPKVPFVIECKDSGWAEPLARYLQGHSKHPVKVISFNHHELSKFHKLCPDVPTYAIEHTSAFSAIQTARTQGFAGIDLNFWLLNPFSFWAARRYKLDVMVYTVNKPWIAAYLRVFFPNLSITTDFPDRMARFRPRRRPQ